MSANGPAWNITVHDDCIGSGVCAGTAPRYFTLDENGYSQPPSGAVTPDEIVLDAAVACPVEAIKVTDAHTGATIEP